jgi:two-component system alkaline phosphatase synthesis response regulator PhoP
MEPRKVLAVDDDDTVLELEKNGLEAIGYTVRTATSGAELFDALKQFTPDVILMDANMPDADGISLCRTLRCSDATKDIPVIIVTAFSDERTFHDAMLFGAADFILKPFEIAEVHAKIGNVLSKLEAKRNNES